MAQNPLDAFSPPEELSPEERRRLYLDCTHYDSGHRNAIRDQLEALAVQAAKQAQRSEITARRTDAAPSDYAAHKRDWFLAESLRALLRHMTGPHRPTW